MLLPPWEAVALEKDFHSQRLTNRIGIHLPAVTKLIVISMFLPNALLLMNGHVLGENMIMALDILSLQIACNTVSRKSHT